MYLLLQLRCTVVRTVALHAPGRPHATVGVVGVGGRCHLMVHAQRAKVLEVICTVLLLYPVPRTPYPVVRSVRVENPPACLATLPAAQSQPTHSRQGAERKAQSANATGGTQAPLLEALLPLTKPPPTQLASGYGARWMQWVDGDGEEHKA